MVSLNLEGGKVKDMYGVIASESWKGRIHDQKIDGSSFTQLFFKHSINKYIFKRLKDKEQTCKKYVQSIQQTYILNPFKSLKGGGGEENGQR